MCGDENGQHAGMASPKMTQNFEPRHVSQMDVGDCEVEPPLAQFYKRLPAIA
jgi:hypothetical protein